MNDYAQACRANQTPAANFSRLDTDRPEVSRLLVAMLQARQAIRHRSWSHPQEPTGEEWWADVLADPRARRVARVAPSRGAITIYRLRYEPHGSILIACTKCDWKAAFDPRRVDCSARR